MDDIFKIVKADGKAEYAAIDAMRGRAGEVSVEIEKSAAEIMTGVRQRGLDAVIAYSRRFDGAEPYEVSKEALDAAYYAIEPSLREAMERSAANIRAYQSALLTETKIWNPSEGVTLGCIVRGISRLGIYVPGGRAAYPSTVLMNAVPARVAGVEEIIMVTPPTQYLSPEVLAAARIAGIDRVIAVGGAQAIAALTYGAGFIPRVDKIVGPGNAYVAAAKRLAYAYGQLDIDMVAGPSEVLVIADETADPSFAAADLLSQAEHDPLASAVLVAIGEETAEKIRAEVLRQAQTLERREIIMASLRDYGLAIAVDSGDYAAGLANIVAPEHLEIMTEDPHKLLPLIKNAGAIFLGKYSPEPLGDYMAGPSHVLPTSATARFFSPLSVDSFLKKTSLIEYSKEAFAAVREDIIGFAKCEGFTAHANSAAQRKP